MRLPVMPTPLEATPVLRASLRTFNVLTGRSETVEAELARLRQAHPTAP